MVTNSRSVIPVSRSSNAVMSGILPPTWSADDASRVEPASAVSAFSYHSLSAASRLLTAVASRMALRTAAFCGVTSKTDFMPIMLRRMPLATAAGSASGTCSRLSAALTTVPDAPGEVRNASAVPPERWNATMLTEFLSAVR